MFQTHTFNSNGHAACRAGAGRDVLRPVRPPRDRRRDTGEVLGPRGLAATTLDTKVLSQIVTLRSVKTRRVVTPRWSPKV